MGSYAGTKLSSCALEAGHGWSTALLGREAGCGDADRWADEVTGRHRSLGKGSSVVRSGTLDAASTPALEDREGEPEAPDSEADGAGGRGR